MKTLQELLQTLPEEQRRWILGNDTKDGLRYAFDNKRVVHAGINGRPIMDPAEQQKVWQEYMSQEDEGGPRSAYIHVPFCEKKCSYCGFFQNASRKEVLNRYTDLVIKEIEQTAQYKRAQTGTINAVYFGGGTPSTLEADDIYRLVKTVRERLPLANDCEITLESRIHDMTDDRIEAAYRAGVNRFSIGVQSFNTKIRQAVGRIDDEAVVIDRLEKLMKADFATIVIDLMFGLPFQTLETWKYDLDKQFELNLHGGDIYQLNVFPGSDLAAHIDRGIVDPCMTTVEQAELYGWTVDYIRNTMPQIDLFDPSHWCRDRRERSMYNGLAKQRADMFSFGSCAGGRVGNLQFMQHRDLNAYIGAMEAGMKPIMMMVDDGGMGRFNGDLKAQLEDSYLDGSYFKRVWNRDVTGFLAPVIEAWQEKGLVTFSHDVMRFTTAGMFWHDNLIQGVLDCMNLEEQQGNLRNERVAHQDVQKGHPGGKPAGHPHGMGGHPHGMGGHPGGMPAGHPGGKPAGHPHGMGGHPHGMGGHPGGKPAGHPGGMPAGHPHGMGGHPHGMGGHPGGKPAGHPGGMPAGHPHGMGGHPHGMGGHPGGKPAGHPGGMPAGHPHGMGGHPGGKPAGHPGGMPTGHPHGIVKDKAQSFVQGPMKFADEEETK